MASDVFARVSDTKVALRKLTTSQAARLKELKRHTVEQLGKICGGDRELELTIGRAFADQISPRAEGPAYRQSVFINCPFDSKYRPLLQAATFAVVWCGFVPRCALEAGDSSQARFEKILNMIEECQYGIHDLSRIELDRGFPRFNMPLELGVFLGAKRYGRQAQDRKSCLIFERKKHTYDKFISDFSGYDVVSHENKSERVVRAIRDWLSSTVRQQSIPGSHKAASAYNKFKKWFPREAKDAGRLVRDLQWIEFADLAGEWAKLNPWA